MGWAVDEGCVRELINDVRSYLCTLPFVIDLFFVTLVKRKKNMQRNTNVGIVEEEQRVWMKE